MSFRLQTIFYAFALLAAAMATFGAWGIPVTGIILACWLVVFRGTHRDHGLLVAFLVVVCLILLFAFVLIPSVSTPRSLARRATCLNNLKQLALSIEFYESQQGHLPPVASVDPQGNELFSWRAALLYYMDEQALYSSLDLTKPWNASANRRTTSTLIQAFQCPEHLASTSPTSYFAIRGPQTLWGDGLQRRSRDIHDNPAHTILLIEADVPTKSWSEPHELNFNEALDLLTKAPTEGDGHTLNGGWFYKRRPSRNVAFADNNVDSLPLPLDRKLATALLTSNGGEDVSLDDIAALKRPQLDFAAIYSFAAFVLLALLPASKLRRGQPPATISPAESPVTRD